MSSSKRGRKRNDLLPPNRARDVQRAFRARRAAHLQALELRVTELEEENILLRQAMNLPQASRPSLGRGPTGNDKPRSGGHYNSYQHLIDVNGAQDYTGSSSPDSEPSTRPNSVSPALLSSSVPEQRSLPPLEGPHWDNAIMIAEPTVDMDYPPSSSPFNPPMSAPLPTKFNSFPPPYHSPAPSPPFVYAPSPGSDAPRENPSPGSYQSSPLPMYSQIPGTDNAKHSERRQGQSNVYGSTPSQNFQSDVSEDGRPSQSFNGYSSSYEGRHSSPLSRPLTLPRQNNMHNSSLSSAMSFPQPFRRHTEPYHYSLAASPQLTAVNVGPHGIRPPSPPHLTGPMYSPRLNSFST